LSRWIAIASAVTVLALLLAGSASALPPTGDFTVSDQVPLIGAAVSFNAVGLSDPDAGGTITGVAWDFGDTTTGGGTSVSHSYAARGSKTITMTVVDSSNETLTVTHSLRVNAPPVAAFTSSPIVAQIAQPITFDGSTSFDPEGAVDLSWSFGDNSVGSGAHPPAHPYAQSGTKTVTLSVTDGDGVTRSVSHTVRVNAPPTAKFTYAALDKFPGQDSRNPYVGERVAFAGGGSSGSSDPDSSPAIARYEWDFNGDGIFADGPASQIVTLTTPGDVPVGLRVTDGDGATNTFVLPIHVDQPPVPSFTFSPQAPKAGQPVQLTSTASDPDGSGDILSQNWDLNGDGRFDDASGPSVLAAFLTPGNYKVGLQVTDRTRVVAIQTQTLGVGVASSGSPPVPLPSGQSGQQLVIVPRPADQESGATGASAASVVPRRGLSVLAGVRVSIAGSVSGERTRITRLIVTAPSGALVKAACRGPGCPAKAERHRAKNGKVRLRRFERTVGVGAQIGVSITKPGFIGKYILFTIRRGKAPSRSVLCLASDGRRAGRCPRS
jgi:PKD repeat protein